MQAFACDFVPGKPFSSDNFRSLQTDSVGGIDGLHRLGISATRVDAVLPDILGHADDRQARLARHARDALRPMRAYLVGGAVRDRLLGLRRRRPRLRRGRRHAGADARRRATSRSARTSRCSCIRRRSEEYALARTERKTAPRLPRLRLPRRPVGDAGAGPGAPRLHHQRDRARTRRARWSIPSAARATSRRACCATSRRPSPRIRCASCASRASWRASRRWASPSRRKRWR